MTIQIGIKKVAVAGMLGIILVASFTALTLLLRERLERGPVATLTSVRSAMALKIGFLAPIGRASQANAAVLHSRYTPASPKFGAILSGALLFVPFGLSTLKLSRWNLALLHLGHRGVIDLKQSIEAVKLKMKACVRFYSRASSGGINK